MSFETVRGRIKTARPYGVVHVELRDRGAIGAEGVADHDACDALTSALGFRTLEDTGSRWTQRRATRLRTRCSGASSPMTTR